MISLARGAGERVGLISTSVNAPQRGAKCLASPCATGERVDILRAQSLQNCSQSHHDRLRRFQRAGPERRPRQPAMAADFQARFSAELAVFSHQGFRLAGAGMVGAVKSTMRAHCPHVIPRNED